MKHEKGQQHQGQYEQTSLPNLSLQSAVLCDPPLAQPNHCNHADRILFPHMTVKVFIFELIASLVQHVLCFNWFKYGKNKKVHEEVHQVPGQQGPLKSVLTDVIGNWHIFLHSFDSTSNTFSQPQSPPWHIFHRSWPSFWLSRESGRIQATLKARLRTLRGRRMWMDD